MFKIIASDMDGTLLTSDRTITENTVETLRRAYDKGVEFVICSGRMYDSLRTMLPQLPFCHYTVSCMGAEIYDNFTKERLYLKPMPHDEVDFLVDYALKNSLHFHIYIDNVLYTNSVDRFSQIYYEETTSMGRQIEGDIREFCHGKDASKMLFFDEPDKVAPHFGFLADKLGDKINVCSSKRQYVEFSHLEAQKDITLNILLEKLGLTKDELIVFGDSGNDISMLENTGFSVCVGNGWPETKKCADIIVESNDNDGVARTVKRLILGELV